MRRLAGTLLVGAAGVLIGLNALAGDKEAHTNATYEADAIVSVEPAFANGVGAPIVDGGSTSLSALYPLFFLPPKRDLCTAYEADAAYGHGCAYEYAEGMAVNEPDNWQCLDPRQPRSFYFSNLLTAPGQTIVATLLGQMGVASEAAAMACNWTHFVSNSAFNTGLGDGGQAPSARQATDTTTAFDAAAAWAETIPDSIEEAGARQFLCDDQTWSDFLRRVYNSLHFAQDAVCEHHAQGNLVCGPNEWNPKFSDVIYDFLEGKSCSGWLTHTLLKTKSPLSSYRCDDALDAAHAATLLGLCSGGLSLACMGLERVLRHHCDLDSPKTLLCGGPPNDHEGGVATTPTWCEGETYSGGGQDFLGAAVSASTPILEQAAKRWAEVCKEPDDPCVPQQCDTWCKRATRTTVGADGSASPVVHGYCVNAQPDSLCVLHECKCAEACGGDHEPCCATAPSCTGSGSQCQVATGTCESSASSPCTPAEAGSVADTSLTASGSVAHGQSVTYSFMASAGNGVQIRVANTGGNAFAPVVEAVDPDGAVVTTGNGASVAAAAFGAQKSGTFKVAISDGSSDAIVVGQYTLYVTVAPGANKGGALSPGGSVSAMLAEGALDSYTLTAQSGESAQLRVTDVAAGPLVPAIWVYDPTGAVEVDAYANDVASVAFTALKSGTYTVVVADLSNGLAATGPYNLSYVLAPGANKGGALSPGATVSATLAEGALDSYTFTAQTGESTQLRVTDIAAGTLVPAIWVYDPTGGLEVNASQPDVASVAFVAPKSGAYTVVVADESAGLAASGGYTLSLTLSSADGG
jgi:hypothetical protein